MNTAAKPAKKTSTSVPAQQLSSREELTALHISALADGKTKYKTADAALDHVIETTCERCPKCHQIIAGQVITLPDTKPIPTDLRGKSFRLVDKFEKRNSIGVGLSARRFELEDLS